MTEYIQTSPQERNVIVSQLGGTAVSHGRGLRGGSVYKPQSVGRPDPVMSLEQPPHAHSIPGHQPATNGNQAE